MLGEQVQNWIESKGPYNYGLQLAKQLGINVPADLLGLKVVFASHREKLVRLLQPHATRSNTPVPVAQSSGQTEPEAVAGIRLQLRDVYKVYGQLKGQLYALCINGQDNTRYDIARQIMEEVIPRINDMASKLNSYERSGILPAFSDREIVRLTVEKMKQLDNLESRVSRIKGWLKTGSAQGESLTKDKIAEYEKEKREKETRIAQLKSELDA